MDLKKIGNNILYFPLTKIIVGLLLVGGSAGIGHMVMMIILDSTSLKGDVKNLIAGIVIAIFSIIVYTYLFKVYENRKITEFAWSSFYPCLSKGILLGFVLQCLTILVIYVKGGYSVESINPWLFLIPPLTMAFTSAIIEEIVGRGIIFRILEEKLGSYLALFISAILFGAMHLGNPNSSYLMAIGLAIQAGLLLGAAYIYSKNLWFPIGIHFAWNFTQSAIFGAKVSGNTVSKTLITSHIEGAQWFTGGAFGPEGSIQATLLCLMATIFLMILSHREGKILKPYWIK